MREKGPFAYKSATPLPEFCINCGEELGRQRSEPELKELKKSKGLPHHRVSDYEYDELTPGLSDKIAGALSIVGIIFALFCNLFLKNDLSGGGLFWIVILLSVNIFCAFFVKQSWELEKIRLSFTIIDPQNAEPSDLWLSMRKIGPWVILLTAGFLFYLLFLVR